MGRFPYPSLSLRSARPLTVGLLSALLLTACATKGALEQLQREVEASHAQIETLKGQTKTGFEATKKQIEERERQLAQDLKALQASVAQLTEAVKEHRAKLAEGATRDERLSKEAEETRALVQSSARTLVEFLKTEEAQLKEGLRWVQSVLKGLALETKSMAEKPQEGQKNGQPEEKPK